MKKLQILSVLCLLFGIWHNFFGSSESFIGIISQASGLTLAMPSLLAFVKKGVDDIQVGDKVDIQYWKRTNCGTDMESTDLFYVEGVVSDVASVYDEKRIFITREDGIVKSVLVSKISKIRFL